MGYNLIMTIKLCMDWGIPHKLVIGWEGVSLTPILVSLTKPGPKTIVFLPVILFFDHLISYLFIISAWWRDLKIKNQNENTQSDLFRVLAIRLLGAFTLYHGWQIILFFMTLWNNWGCPMGFELGLNDVSLFPVLENPG